MIENMTEGDMFAECKRLASRHFSVERWEADGVVYVSARLRHNGQLLECNLVDGVGVEKELLKIALNYLRDNPAKP